jgi:hypothetical protein
MKSSYAFDNKKDKSQINTGCTTRIVTLSYGAQYEDCIYGDYLGFLVAMLTWVDMNDNYCLAPQPGTPVYLF